jgi:protein O-mannosyl-transferase
MSSEKRNTIIALFIVVAATLISFYPSLHGGFVNFDDDRYVYRNPMIRDLSWQGTATIFTSTDYAVIYCPLVFLSYAIEYHFFDLHPYAYHMTNLVLHLCNCVLVFWFVLLLSRSISTALIVALLFGVHPLRVESVAWITERKDVLYASFFLAALVCYCYYLAHRSTMRYLGVVLFFLLSLLSKPAALVLPVVLLLCDYLRGAKIDRKNLLAKLPLFSIAAAFLILGFFTAKDYARKGPAFTMFDQLFIPPYALLFYLYKSIMPVRLSCLYPFPVTHGDFLPAVFLLSPLTLILLGGLVAFSTRSTRKLAFGSLFFLITVLPALQFFPTGTAIVADRFIYIPSIGLSFLLAELIAWLYGRKRKFVAHLAAASFAVLITALSALTRSRCAVWNSNIALWDDAVRKYPDGYIPLAYFNRGIVYTDMGLHEKAVSDFNRVLTLYYRERGMDGDHTGTCRALIATGGGPAEAYHFLASRYAEIGKTQEAIGCLNVSRRLRGESGVPPQTAPP